jgi:tetratricopeptide (TPR) repeat protein
MPVRLPQGSQAGLGAAAIERAFGPARKGFQTFGAALHDADTARARSDDGADGARAGSAATCIVRATAAAELRNHLNAATLLAIEAALADADPMVRAAALRSAAGGAASRAHALGRRTDRRSLANRAHQGRARTRGRAYEGMAPEMQARFEKAFAEYVASQRANADRPEAHMNLGLFYVERRDPVPSEAEYRAALALQPDFIPRSSIWPICIAVTSAKPMPKRADRGLAESARQRRPVARTGLVARARRTRRGALPLLADAARANPANARYAMSTALRFTTAARRRRGSQYSNRHSGDFRTMGSC